MQFTKNILPYISLGNIKVKCPIFNLPSSITCRKNIQCKQFCYAKKAEKLYSNVLPCRLNNFKISKQPNFVDLFCQQLNKILTKRSNKFNKNYVRLHESGDIYSIEYLNKLYEIAKKFPNITFYAYTKRIDILTPELLSKRPSNFIVNYSVDGLQKEIPNEIPEGFDNVTVIHETKTNCPALKDKSKKCMKDCFKCAKRGNIIIFKKH